MHKKMIWILPFVFALLVGQASAQTDPAQTPAPKVARPPAPKPLIETLKPYVILAGATIDEAKSTATMIVSNHPDSKGNKTNVVILHDKKKGFLGFYIYNFGSVKDLTPREEVFKYLLSVNDSITIGSFFVDGDEDIGYKYLISTAQAMNQKAFEAIYLTMLAVAREHKAEIRKLLGNKDDKPTGVRKTTEEKPPETDSIETRSYQQPEPTFQKEDLGVDTAVVIANMANLREEPNDSSAVIQREQKDSLLALVDRTPIGPWYNVIDVKSSKEGWIHGNTIKIFYSKNKKSSAIFQAERTGTNEDPTIELSNNSNKDLNLRVGRNIYIISAFSKKKIQMASGQYKYYASAPAVLPAFGEQIFNSGYRYTWTFWIETVSR